MKPLHKKSKAFAAASPSHQQYTMDRVCLEVQVLDSPIRSSRMKSAVLHYLELHISTTLEGCSSPTGTHEHCTYDSSDQQNNGNKLSVER